MAPISIRKLFRSVLISLRIMNAPPTIPPLEDPHQIWFLEDDRQKVGVEVYRDVLVLYYGRTGAVVGPHHWYISRLDIVKNGAGLEHERIVATLKRTPREGEDPDATERFLVVERMMDNNEAARKARRQVTAQEGIRIIDRDYESIDFLRDSGKKFSPGNENDDNGGSSSGNSLSGVEATIKAATGAKPAHDIIRYASTHPATTSKNPIVAWIELPAPPTLPRADVATALLDVERSSQAGDSTAFTAGVSDGPSSQPPPSPMHTRTLQPNFVSLTAYINLVCVIHSNKALYRLFSQNCYWFVGMIMHCVRLHTGAPVLTGDTNPEQPGLTASDDCTNFGDGNPLNIDTKRFPGSFKSVLRIVNVPANRTLRRMIQLWDEEEARIESKLNNARLIELRNIEGPRREVMKERRQREEERRQREEERRQKEEERRQKEEERRQKEEAERRANEERRQKEEAERRADEEKQKREALEKRMVELQRQLEAYQQAK